MAVHHNFRSLGHEIAQSWGPTGDTNRSDIIKTSNDERKILCVLCAIHQETQWLRDEISALRRATATPRPSHPVSDGMREALQRFDDQPSRDFMSQLDLQPLTIRAIKTLLRLKPTSLDDITEERLLGLRNCGMMTTHIILEWKAKQLTLSNGEGTRDGEADHG